MGLISALRIILRKNSAGSDFNRRRLNLIEGANVTLTVTDDAANDEVDVQIASSGGAGGYATVRENGTDLTQRSNLNFVDGLIAADDAGSSETDVNLDYGTTTELADVAAAEGAGTSAKVARGDHVHAHGSGYLPDAHHARSHDHSNASDGTALVPESVEITGGPFSLRGDVSPAQITANQNDYNPAGLADAAVLRLNTDAARNITGLAGGADGRCLIVFNVGGNTFTLKDDDAASAAANRFSLLGDVTVQSDEGLALWYDSTTSRWRMQGRVGAPSHAPFVCVTNDGLLSDERRLQGTTNKIALTDGGAGGDLTLNTGSLVVHTDQANTYTAGAQSLAAAASLLVPASGGAAPTADGSLAYDTTQDAWKGGGAGAISGAFGRVLKAALGNGTATDLCDANGAADGTTEKTFATNFSIPANFLVTNKALWLWIHYEVTTTGSPPTLTLRLKLGATNVYASSAGAALASLTTRGGVVGWLLQGTAAPGASVSVMVGNTPVTEPFYGGGAGPNTIAQAVGGLATNGALTLQASAQWGTATAGNTIRLHQFAVLEMN